MLSIYSFLFSRNYRLMPTPLLQLSWLKQQTRFKVLKV